MIEAISHLWDLMTIFFTSEVIYHPLFMAMILFVPIFYTVYYLMNLLDPNTWGARF